MNQNLKHFIYGAILLSGGLYLGNMIGSANMLKETSDIIASSHIDNYTANLNLHLFLLNKLHANETDKLIQTLENLVNSDLTALAVYSEVPPERRMPSTLKSIKNAKEYRLAHPITIQDDKVSREVTKAFDLVK